MRVTPEGVTHAVTRSGAARSAALEARAPSLAREAAAAAKAAANAAATIAAVELDELVIAALEVGCSTGGFSHVMLERGAKAVLGVDTGRDQFDAGLADDPRMIVRESTNVKDLTPAEVKSVMGGLPELVVIDVSFVGLSHIFPTVAALTTPGTPVVALVKPQFEVGRENLSRAGIVRDPVMLVKALDDVKDAAVESGFGVIDALDSPIQGGDGNHEYLLRLERL